MDIPEQVCITKDNVQVAVDGILYLKVMDPERASYGISNYNFAITQLAQTTLRSEIGKIDLDRTFEERTYVNTQVVTEVDKASEAWGVKVLRYEIKNITPPAGHPRRHGEADAGRAREARGHPAVRGRARRRHQHRRGPEAAGHQGLGGEQAAADQRGRGPGRGHPRGGQGHGRGHPLGGRRPSRPTAASRRCSSAWPSSTSRSSATWRRPGNSLIIPSNLADVGSMIATAMNVIQSRGRAGAAARRPAALSRGVPRRPADARPSRGPSGRSSSACARRARSSAGCAACPTTGRRAGRRCARSAASCASAPRTASRRRSRPRSSSSRTATRPCC